MRGALNVETLLLEGLPSIFDYSGRIIEFFYDLWVPFEVELGNVRVCRLYIVLLVVQASSFITRLVLMLCILYFKHLKILLSTSIVMFSSRPIIIEFSSNFAISLLNVSLLHEWMLEELRPSESLIRCFVQETLQK